MIAARALLHDEIDLRDFLRVELSRAYERVDPRQGLPVVAREGPLLERAGARVLRVFQVREDQAVVAVHRVNRLRPPQRYSGIKRVRARPVRRRDGVIVDRHGMVAGDELHVGVFSRDDLAHPADPDRAVQHADALHLEHQLVLRESGVLGLEPVQALRRADFLNIEEFEEGLEMLVPFAHVRADECTDGFRAPAVDIAEQAALDLVVDGRAEEGRVQVLLAERPRGRRVVPRGVLNDHAAVRKDPPIRRHVDIGKRRAAGLEESLLIPLRDVVVVSRDRHRSDSFDIANTPTH